MWEEDHQRGTGCRAPSPPPAALTRCPARSIEAAAATGPSRCVSLQLQWGLTFRLEWGIHGGESDVESQSPSCSYKLSAAISCTDREPRLQLCTDNTNRLQPRRC